MVSIFPIQDPVAHIGSIEIFECILKETENYYPAHIDGNLFILFPDPEGNWETRAFSKDICNYISSIIREYESATEKADVKHRLL